MNKKGVALIFGLLVVLVLAILASSFALRSVNESNLVKRHVNSIRAFWLAEAGVAEAIANLPSVNSSNGTLGEPKGESRFEYTAQPTLVSYDASTNESTYTINSTGTVIMPAAGSISRNIEVFVRLSPPDPGGFDFAIEVQGELKIAGNPEINPADSTSEYSVFTFQERFNLSPEEVRDIAITQGTYYEDPPSPLQNFYGLNWVKITEPNKQLKIPKTGWEGNGILIVEGETDIEGGTFDGIIWVIGELTISGNPVITGSVIAESGTKILTSVTGTPSLTHDPAKIEEALGLLTSNARRTIVSWREY